MGINNGGVHVSSSKPNSFIKSLSKCSGLIIDADETRQKFKEFIDIQKNRRSLMPKESKPKTLNENITREDVELMIKTRLEIFEKNTQRRRANAPRQILLIFFKKYRLDNKNI